MAEVKILVGFPGCGKSTYSHSLKNFVVLSTDKIRKELYGDESIQGNSNKVFGIIFYRMGKLLRNGKNIIIDATNIAPRDRKTFIRIAKENGAKVTAVIFDVSIDICKERNRNRLRVVPEFVYDKMAKRYVKPSIEEGFNAIETISV